MGRWRGKGAELSGSSRPASEVRPVRLDAVIVNNDTGSIVEQALPLLLPQSEDGKWNKYGGRLAWDKSAICCNNPTFGGTGNAKTGEDYVAAPNIDHTQVCWHSASLLL